MLDVEEKQERQPSIDVSSSAMNENQDEEDSHRLKAKYEDDRIKRLERESNLRIGYGNYSDDEAMDDASGGGGGIHNSNQKKKSARMKNTSRKTPKGNSHFGDSKLKQTKLIISGHKRKADSSISDEPDEDEGK